MYMPFKYVDIVVNKECNSLTVSYIHLQYIA